MQFNKVFLDLSGKVQSKKDAESIPSTIKVFQQDIKTPFRLGRVGNKLTNRPSALLAGTTRPDRPLDRPLKVVS